jgi:uncharacterized protein (TIGR03435 family)
MNKLCQSAIPVVCLLNLAATTAPAQSAFEAASIRLHPPAPGPLRSSSHVGPAGVTFTNVYLKSCIRAAYEVKSYQIAGGPDWLTSERFDVVAKAAAPVSKGQLMLMFRTLLEDRCKLKTHRETRELPVYSLVVARGGPKLHTGKEDGATEVGGSGHTIDSRGMTMQQLAGILSQFTGSQGRPVLDATGLSGYYDIKLDLGSSDPAGGDNSSGSDLFIAVQELGLKLEARKYPVEVLVIDQVEKPSEN